MTDPGDRFLRKLISLSDALVDRILELSDHEILAEAKEDGEDARLIAESVRALFEKAVAANAKSRLSEAKAAVQMDRRRNQSTSTMSVAEARERLQHLIANNPKALSMAARKAEGELSESEIIGLIEDLEDLGGAPPQSGNDKR